MSYYTLFIAFYKKTKHKWEIFLKDDVTVKVCTAIQKISNVQNT